MTGVQTCALPISLIAMIQGFCIGGGLATALNADVRFATPDSTFGIPAARLGLGYEYEGLRHLTDLVGPSRPRTSCSALDIWMPMKRCRWG